MTDESKSYRVTDRRHGVHSEDASPEVEAPASAAPETPAPAPGSDENVPEPPADFVGFIVSLGAQAGMLLQSTEAADLKGAKWLISILEMLRDKTEGRRTEEESRALDTLLYELRLGYVKRSRAGGA